MSRCAKNITKLSASSKSFRWWMLIFCLSAIDRNLTYLTEHYPGLIKFGVMVYSGLWNSGSWHSGWWWVHGHRRIHLCSTKATWNIIEVVGHRLLLLSLQQRLDNPLTFDFRLSKCSSWCFWCCIADALRLYLSKILLAVPHLQHS